MQLTPAQTKILEDRHRFRVAVCGRKFGKTTLFAEELVANAMSGNDRRVMYMAPYLGDARRLMWERLKKYGVSIGENETRLELKVATPYKGTSIIFLGSWEKVQSYRGDEFDFIECDECQDYRNFWVGWQEALRPTLTPRKGDALFGGTPKGFNHLYDLYNEQYKDADWQSFKFTTYDNPFIDPQEIEKARKDETEDRFAQEYLADFRKSEGLVFKEFSRETHIFTEKVTGYIDFLAGVDFGYTNPLAIEPIYVKEGKFYVGPGEVYRTGMTDDESADYVAAQRFNKVYPDPAQPQSIEAMKRKGVNIRDVKKGPDSIVHGIQTMRELFKQNRLFIHESCTNLINELESYAYPNKSPYHNANEKPIDEYNHAIDAVRYVLDNYTISKPFIPPRHFYDRTIEIWKGH